MGPQAIRPGSLILGPTRREGEGIHTPGCPFRRQPGPIDGRARIRTWEDVRQRVYSPTPLATWVHALMSDPEDPGPVPSNQEPIPDSTRLPPPSNPERPAHAPRFRVPHFRLDTPPKPR